MSMGMLQTSEHCAFSLVCREPCAFCKFNIAFHIWFLLSMRWPNLWVRWMLLRVAHFCQWFCWIETLGMSIWPSEGFPSLKGCEQIIKAIFQNLFRLAVSLKLPDVNPVLATPIMCVTTLSVQISYLEVNHTSTDFSHNVLLWVVKQC